MSSTVPSTIWGLIKVAGDGLVAPVFHHSPVALLIVKSIIIVSPIKLTMAMNVSDIFTFLIPAIWY